MHFSLNTNKLQHVWLLEHVTRDYCILSEENFLLVTNKKGP